MNGQQFQFISIYVIMRKYKIQKNSINLISWAHYKNPQSSHIALYYGTFIGKLNHPSGLPSVPHFNSHPLQEIQANIKITETPPLHSQVFL